MNPKFWQTKKFKELDKEWRTRLESSGFKDAEELRGNGEIVLRQNSSNSYRNLSQVQRENRLKYYEILEAKLHLEQFENKIHRLIMERRAEGIQIKNISEELKVLDEACHRQTVRKVIRKYEIKWGIRRKK